MTAYSLAKDLVIFLCVRNHTKERTRAVSTILTKQTQPIKNSLCGIKNTILLAGQWALSIQPKFRDFRVCPEAHRSHTGGGCPLLVLTDTVRLGTCGIIYIKIADHVY